MQIFISPRVNYPTPLVSYSTFPSLFSLDLEMSCLINHMSCPLHLYFLLPYLRDHHSPSIFLVDQELATVITFISSLHHLRCPSSSANQKQDASPPSSPTSVSSWFRSPTVSVFKHHLASALFLVGSLQLSPSFCSVPHQRHHQHLTFILLARALASAERRTKRAAAQHQFWLAKHHRLVITTSSSVSADCSLSSWRSPSSALPCSSLLLSLAVRRLPRVS